MTLFDLRYSIDYLKAIGLNEIFLPEERICVHDISETSSMVDMGSKASSGYFSIASNLSLFSDDQSGIPQSLEEVRQELGDCTRCKLSPLRKNIVFGTGSENADIVFIGEGPGADEDEQGIPFVGRAGQLLTKIIENGMGLKRKDVYICNIIKCRPPGNRDPEKDEISACLPFLEKQLIVIKPRVIMTLGKPAASTLLGKAVTISKIRGKWQNYKGIKLMPTYHPAYLLRNYSKKTRQEVWDDVRSALREIEKVQPSQ